MKPIKNLKHLLKCPVAHKCDQNFGNLGRGCHHATPHKELWSCNSINCRGYTGVQCVEVNE